MPYLFTCPECHTKTQVEDQYSGMQGQCVTCGADIQLPHFVGHSPAPSAPTAAKGNRVFGWAAASMVSILLLGSLLFAVVRLGGRTMTRLANSRQQSASIRNLEKIATAMNAYAADHGTYPPPYTRDAKQAPLHSWRVLLLPYLGEEDLYSQFNLGLPWDHSVNREAANYMMPSVYQHPAAADIGLYNQSGYYLIVGPGTLFPRQGPLGPDDILDDPSQTILVTEAVPIAISSLWTEPIDLDVTKMQGRVGSNLGNEPGGLIDGGAAVVTADQRGHFIRDTIDPSIFRALVTPDGDERLADDVLD